MRKCIIALLGETVLLLGAAMLILPGPGLLVVAAGLTILATEFLWARRMLGKARDTAAHLRGCRFRFPFRKRDQPG